MNVKSTPIPGQHSFDNYDLICFSHLRWDFVYQRPQHLISRFSKVFRTFFIEEPKPDAQTPELKLNWIDNKLCVVTPLIPPHASEQEIPELIRALLTKHFTENQVNNYIFWYYTPMALSFSDTFKPRLVVYDCMDELSAFNFAPPKLKELEKKLLDKADLVFTGGVSLYEAKKHQHHNIHPFPSSIDKEHFAKGRDHVTDPADQANIPHPRIGFYGVVDERFDLELIEQVSADKPEWHFVIVGPVVKIDPAILPRKNNIHYLGGKSYAELPGYLGGWDIAMIPFARNESTRFISPTKTPEYLAAGKPVISTSIQDVVDPYAKNQLVHIADTPGEFIKVAENILSDKNNKRWLASVDLFLQNNSWDKTWMSMMQLIQKAVKENLNVNTKKTKEAYV